MTAHICSIFSKPRVRVLFSSKLRKQSNSGAFYLFEDLRRPYVGHVVSPCCLLTLQTARSIPYTMFSRWQNPHHIHATIVSRHIQYLPRWLQVCLLQNRNLPHVQYDRGCISELLLVHKFPHGFVFVNVASRTNHRPKS